MQLLVHVTGMCAVNLHTSKTCGHRDCRLPTPGCSLQMHQLPSAPRPISCRSFNFRRLDGTMSIKARQQVMLPCCRAAAVLAVRLLVHPACRTCCCMRSLLPFAATWF